MVTNYEKHFGDPLRAAEVLERLNPCLKRFAAYGDPSVCYGCPMLNIEKRSDWCDQSVEKWLEWLLGEEDNGD